MNARFKQLAEVAQEEPYFAQRGGVLQCNDKLIHEFKLSGLEQAYTEMLLPDVNFLVLSTCFGFCVQVAGVVS